MQQIEIKENKNFKRYIIKSVTYMYLAFVTIR